MVFKGLHHFTQEKKLSQGGGPVAFLSQNGYFYSILKGREHQPTPLTSTLGLKLLPTQETENLAAQSARIKKHIFSWHRWIFPELEGMRRQRNK